MSHPPAAPVDRFATIVEALRDDPGVTHPPETTAPKKGFGSSALKVNDKIFAMLVGDNLVVKLARQRVDTLVVFGAGERFDPGHGRLMKEWLTVPPTSDEAWLPLAQEAMAFVSSRR